MKRICIAIAALPLLAGAGQPQWRADSRPNADALRKEIAATPEKSGGIYFAYPVTADDEVTVPEGFEPVFLTHYGRHGSRWCLKDYQYGMADSVFAFLQRTGNLTPLGLDVQQRLLRIGQHAKGHAGELSPLGERQHKAIASRMAARFPSLFADSTRVEARSSQVPRCIMSMAAFTERLKEINPALKVQRHATPGDMEFIAYDSPDAYTIGSRDAPWRRMERQMRDSLIDPARLLASLMVSPASATDSLIAAVASTYSSKKATGKEKKDSPKLDGRQMQQLMMKVLHDIAVDIQDVDGLEDVTLLDIFTPEECFNLWQMLNLDMYYRHANAEGNGQAGMNSARHMLQRLIAVADTALAQPGKPDVPVQLHFGHDTHLIRLLALMGVEGCSRSEGNPARYCEAWQDFRVSPMAANLQVVFFRNPQGRVLTLLRHNEQNVSLPIPNAKEGAPFYEWTALRKYLISKL